MEEKLGEKAVCRTGVSARGEMVGSVPEEMEGGDFLMGVMLSPTSASTCTQIREEGGGGKREREREGGGKGKRERERGKESERGERERG